MSCSLKMLAVIPGSNTAKRDLPDTGAIGSVAERGMGMWGEFNVGDKSAKSRPPTTVRIEVELLKGRITAVWRILQTQKEVVFPMTILSGDDVRDVLSIAQTAIAALEKEDPPFRFMDGDSVEVWHILNDGEPGRLATATVSVALCSERARKENPYAN